MLLFWDLFRESLSVKIKAQRNIEVGEKVKLGGCPRSFLSMHSLSLTLRQPLIDRLGLPWFLSPCFTGWLYKVFDSKQFFFLFFFLKFCSLFFALSFSKNIYTYHSLKFDDSVLWLVVWCTAVAAGDMELLLWFSVDGDTMVGGVEDSYPELAAGDGCGPGLVDSWTFHNDKKRRKKCF